MLRTIPIATLALLIALPRLASAQTIVNEWGASDIEVVVATADLSADPGLEALATLRSTGDVAVVRLADGSALATLPSPYQRANENEYVLRDVDGDGTAEILVARWDSFSNSGSVAVLDVGPGGVTPVFSKGRAMQVRSLDAANLSGGGASALVVADVGLQIMDASSGAVLYDSGSDPSLPSLVLFDSSTIGDFDGDGAEEVLAVFTTPPTNGAVTVLIGAGTSPTSVDDAPGAGVSSFLMQSAPNPSGGSTAIRFRLPRTDTVRLRVFDASGRLVRTLIDERRAAGEHLTVWDARDDDGRAVAGGVYFYELQLPDERLSRKMMVVR